ncbi:uncharacterized protein LOC129746690 [Uranotaenia lowii]|uniref:uncharacterized protein LOC129746690 n=1 Tax=Uranotaenia lowii TaxID=190385 RepID=UPI0024786EBD|nr:uncharacterized protein LOC129746690 [Uranotaenia lowii]
MEIKSCAVDKCSANSDQCPYLFFLKVPLNINRRIDWCDAMGIANQKGTLYCCTRHFDIPGDFDGESSTEKTGVRLKLKTDVLPHKSLPGLNSIKNIYAIFEQVKINGKVDKFSKFLLPIIQHDLQIQVPLTIKTAALQKAFQFVVDTITTFFATDGLKSRFNLVETLRQNRNALLEIINEKPPCGEVQGTIALRTIMPFLQYEAHGSLEVPIDRKRIESLYFEIESNTLNACLLPVKREQVERDNFEDLLFIPGIKITLSLPFFEVCREILSNSEMFIVSRKELTSKGPAKASGVEMFQKVDKPYRLKTANIGQHITLEYLYILIELLELYDFMMEPKQKLILIMLLKQIRHELTDYDMRELNVVYARYLSRFKYYRTLNHHIKPEQDEPKVPMYVKEIINPELNIQILSAIDVDSAATERIEAYFKPILEHLTGKGDENAYLRFVDKLKTCISYGCEDCDVTFESEIGHLSIEEHRQCGRKIWKCSNCSCSFPETNISSKSWSHDCSRSATPSKLQKMTE